jgi:hypothetical protein
LVRHGPMVISGATRGLIFTVTNWACLLVLASQFRPTAFGEFAKDIRLSAEVGSPLSVEFWSVIGFDDPLHDPLGGFYRSIGRK